MSHAVTGRVGRRIEEKGTDQGTGVQKPLVPSFLPAWLVLGSTAPDIWGGGYPPAPVFRMWA